MQHEHVSAAAERNQLCCSPPLSYSDSVEQHRACGGAGPGQDVAHDTGCSAWEGGPADYMDIIGYFSASYTLLFPTPSPELPFGPTHTPGGAKLKATTQTMHAYLYIEMWFHLVLEPALHPLLM